MIMMVIQHKVENYDAWKSEFDGFTPLDAGAAFHRVNRGMEDPNSVAVVTGWQSLEEANAFRSNPELKEKMAAAGVLGAPRIEIYTEVEAVEA